MLYLWLAVIVLGILVEAFTLNLVAIWFALGAVASLVAYSMNLPEITQLIIFVLFSAVLLALVRPFCRKFLHTKKQPTNADRIIGQRAVVSEPIDNTAESGAVRIAGQTWTARSLEQGQTFAAGEMVEVCEIRGVKAIVKKPAE